MDATTPTTPGPTDAGPTDAGHDLRVVDAAQERLREAATDLRSALVGFEGAEKVAWRSYARNVGRALAQLDDELDVARAELTAASAASGEELAESLRRARSSWATISDEMRLQAHLGEMQVRDLYRRADEDLHQAGALIQANLDSLGHDAADELAAVREQTSKALGKLRSAIFGLRLASSRTDEAAPGRGGDAGQAGADEER